MAQKPNAQIAHSVCHRHGFSFAWNPRSVFFTTFRLISEILEKESQSMRFVHLLGNSRMKLIFLRIPIQCFASSSYILIY